MKLRTPLRLGRKAVRAASGGVIVVVALLALLFMQGPGTGDSDGESEEQAALVSGNDALAAADSTNAMLTSQSQQEQESEGLTEQEMTALNQGTLVVLIDEHDYLIDVSDTRQPDWQPIDLERLVTVARQADGDSNGIRVRIEKRVTARASAEQQILSTLETVGIGADAVFESSELID